MIQLFFFLKNHLQGIIQSIFYYAVYKNPRDAILMLLLIYLCSFCPIRRVLKMLLCYLFVLLLTDRMKKSWCKILTMPKFVYLKMLSIIHMRFGRTCLRALNAAIRKGTSPVDWWFAITNVRSSRHGVMSSPASTTKKKKTLTITRFIFIVKINNFETTIKDYCFMHLKNNGKCFGIIIILLFRHIEIKWKKCVVKTLWRMC